MDVLKACSFAVLKVLAFFVCACATVALLELMHCAGTGLVEIVR